jgi:cephalosporin hydroxylase
MQGWFSTENKKNLEYLITTYKPKCIVELGTWLGLSAIHMASILPDYGIVYAIDDWTADLDIYIKNTPGLELKIPTLYQQFLSNVKHANLCHKIVPVRMKTLEAAQSLNLKPELIYIDSSHDEVSVFSDIMNWYPKLNNDGTLCRV